MNVTINIEVRNRKEADALRRALEEPDVRAFVLVVGMLLPLPSDRARTRCLNFVRDHFAEANFLIDHNHIRGAKAPRDAK